MDFVIVLEYVYMFELVKNVEKIFKGELFKEELGIKVINDYELEIILEIVILYFDDLLVFFFFLL